MAQKLLISVLSIMGLGSFTACDNNLQSIIDYYAQNDPTNELSWTQPSFSRRIKVSFNQDATLWGSASSVTDFPVLLELTSQNFDYNLGQNGVLRIVHPRNNFAELPYEVEQWQVNNVSTLWVKIDHASKSNNDDFIFIYYGSATGNYPTEYPAQVWSDKYKLAYHLNGSQGNANSAGANGSSSGITPTSNECMIGQCINLNGGSKYINTNFNEDLSQWTLSLWVKHSSLPVTTTNANALFTMGNSYALYYDNSNASYQGALGVNSMGNGQKFSSLSENSWQHLAVSYDGSSLRLYRNGVLQTTKSVGALNSAGVGNNAEIGRNSACGAGDCFFTGFLDEIRLSNAVRSDAQIHLEYQSIMQSFLQFDEVQVKL